MSIIIEVLKNCQRINHLNFLVSIVGSRKLSSTEGRIWKMLEPNLTILGFDADEDACAIDNENFAQSQATWKEKYIPLALSDRSQETTLYVTRALHCSSLYLPNEPYLSRFVGMDKGIQLDFTVELETTTLDKFCKEEGIDKIDFLQVDVQGADLDVLKGATDMLKNILGLQVEVEFAEMYKGQSLFTDTELFLRQQDFTLFDLITKDGWCRRPRSCSPIFSSQRIGQLLWADALYLRDPLSNKKCAIAQSPEAILKLVCISAVLDYPDFSLELLSHLTVTFGQKPEWNFANEILMILSQFPELVEQNLHSLPIVQKVSSHL